MQELRSYVTPWRASSSYRFHVHTFCHACTRMKSGSPLSLQHPILSKKTLEIKNVLAATPIFKKSWSLWTKAWLTSSLLEQISKNISREIPSNWPIIFVQNNDSTRRNWGANMVKSLNTIRRGIAPPFQNKAYSCSAKKIINTSARSCLQKLLDFFNLFQFLSVIWLKIPQDFPCPLSLSC